MSEVHKRFTRQLAVSYDFSIGCMDVQYLIGREFHGEEAGGTGSTTGNERH